MERGKRPVHDRDPLGRHRVDLRQIRSPLLRYGLALAVVGGVVGVAMLAWQDDPLTDADVAWIVPWLGGAVLVIVAVAVALRLRGR